jgi:CheY-like chemotaxis protein
MTRKILFVDDEPMLLEAYRRLLRGTYEVETAEGPEKGLAAIEQRGPFAVICSDLRMPGMDGITFLTKTRELAPDSIRIIITGFGDMEAAVAAINQGSIFRFLTKPCTSEQIRSALEAAIKQYHLVVAERELLVQTLGGAVRILSDILALISPIAFGRALRLKRTVHHIAEGLGLEDLWQYEMAGLLSQIGCVTLPADTLDKAWSGREMSESERKQFQSHPIVGSSLLAMIPRLEPVARMIALQAGDAAGSTAKDPPMVIMGGKMLRLAAELDEAILRGETLEEVTARLSMEGRYPLELLATLAGLHMQRTAMEQRSIHVRDLTPKMILDEDVRSRNGTLLVAKGFEVTPTMIMRLQNFSAGVGVIEPFRVLVRESMIEGKAA